MIEFADTLLRPVATLLLGIARFLLWLGWEFFVQTVGWSIGWLVCRAIFFGRFPTEALGDRDEASFGTALMVELVGLATLAGTVWLLSRHLSV